MKRDDGLTRDDPTINRINLMNEGKYSKGTHIIKDGFHGRRMTMMMMVAVLL